MQYTRETKERENRILIHNNSCSLKYREQLCANIFFTSYLVTTPSISGSNGAAKDGSRWINVPRVIIHNPSSSSEYSSIIVPHSEHLYRINRIQCLHEVKVLSHNFTHIIHKIFSLSSLFSKKKKNLTVPHTFIKIIKLKRPHGNLKIGYYNTFDNNIINQIMQNM